MLSKFSALDVTLDVLWWLSYQKSEFTI